MEGSVLKLKDETYKIINPFKMDWKKYVVLLYDLGFWVSLILLSTLYIYLEYRLIKTKVLVLDFMSVLQGYGINQAYDLLLSFWIYSVIFTLLFLMLVSLSRSYFRMKSICKIFNKRFPKKEFWKYYFSNLICLPILTGLVVYLFVNFTNPDPLNPDLKGIYLGLFLIFLFSHYAFFYTLNFLETKKAFLSMKKGTIDSMNIKYFGLPYLFFILMSLLVSFLIFLMPSLFPILLIGYLVVFLWTREYMRLCYEK